MTRKNSECEKPLRESERGLHDSHGIKYQQD